jgi:hypothetical protein
MRTGCSSPRRDKSPPVRPLTRYEKARIFHWIRVVEELVRRRQLVRGDECLAKTIIDYPSVAAVGWTWPGELRLAAALNESDRNIRKREKRLRAAGVLVVVAPGEGWRSNRYVPVLDNRPLVESALGSAKVRAAISAQCGDDHRATRATSESIESGTTVPPREEPAFHPVRNERSAEPGGETLRENISPTPYPAPTRKPPQREEEAFHFQEAARPGDQLPGNPHLQDHERDQQGGPPFLEIAFARLIRDYPHPPGSLDHAAYRPSARKAWNRLTSEQQQAAAQAASKAPGKEWLSCWLNDGREIGNFEIVARQPATRRVWVRQGTPQFKAWMERYRANGRRPQTTRRMIGGELQIGWMFETEWPPVVKQAASPESRDG